MASSSKFISSASTSVKTGMGKVRGIVIATTSSGTYTLYDNAVGDNTGRQMSGTVTPAAGSFIDWFDMVFRDGLAVVVSGTLTFTVIYE